MAAVGLHVLLGDQSEGIQMKMQKNFQFQNLVRPKLRTKIIAVLVVCMLLCGFSWNWAISFTMRVLFPVEEAVDIEMIQDFPTLVNADDLMFYLTESEMAQQITQGIQSNLSANVYSNISLPDLTLEHPGKRIIRTILDRIFQ